MRTLGVLVSVGIVVAVTAIVGLRLLADEPTYDPETPLATQCDEVPEDAARITLTGRGGMTLGGALVGSEEARVGVVLRQGGGQTICEWLPLAGEFAEQSGVRVLLFDRRGRGSSPGEESLSAEPGDLVLAAEFLRHRGVKEVALVASSMGNSVMFAALDRLPFTPCALVAISPVLVASDSNGMVDGRPMQDLPNNIWVTWERSNSDVVAGAELIQSQARDQGLSAPHLLSVDTDDHSVGLVEGHADVRDFVGDAVGSCRPVR